MRRAPRHIVLSVILCAALLWPLAGCEEEVVGPPGLEAPFTVWGILNPLADTQWVWVFPIEDRLRAFDEKPLGARVTTTHLETGNARVWSDSLVLQDDGLLMHVYWSVFRPVHGESYGLSVVREDGAETIASTVIPEAGSLRRPPPIGLSFVPLDIVTNAPRLNRLTVTYHIQYGPHEDMRWRVAVPYNRMKQAVEEGWRIVIDLKSDYQYLVGLLENLGWWDPFYGVGLVSMRVDLIVSCDDWKPPEGYVFDPEELVYPGALTNAGNGFGFFGAGYRLHDQWLPPDEVLRTAGFRSRLGAD